MEIQTRKLADIKPYEKNPRKNDAAVKYVAESIKQFGFKVPIVVDKDGVIVAGHTRYKAAKQLHMSEVPVVIADDLNDEQIKAFRLADNKVAEKAEWDFELLDIELDGIFDIDMNEFGFVDVEPDDFDMEDLDAENDAENVYTINLRFDKFDDYERCKNAIENIVENFNGRLSVKME